MLVMIRIEKKKERALGQHRYSLCSFDMAVKEWLVQQAVKGQDEGKEQARAPEVPAEVLGFSSWPCLCVLAEEQSGGQQDCGKPAGQGTTKSPLRGTQDTKEAGPKHTAIVQCGEPLQSLSCRQIRCDFYHRDPH